MLGHVTGGLRRRRQGVLGGASGRRAGSEVPQPGSSKSGGPAAGSRIISLIFAAQPSAHAVEDRRDPITRPINDRRESVPIVPERGVEFRRCRRFLAPPEIAPRANPIEFAGAHPGDQLPHPPYGKWVSRRDLGEKPGISCEGILFSLVLGRLTDEGIEVKVLYRTACHPHEGAAEEKRFTRDDRARSVRSQFGCPRPLEEGQVESHERQAREWHSADDAAKDQLDQLER